MDMSAANLGGRSIALGSDIQLFSPEYLPIDQYWLAQRKDFTAHIGAPGIACVWIFSTLKAVIYLARSNCRRAAAAAFQGIHEVIRLLMER